MRTFACVVAAVGFSLAGCGPTPPPVSTIDRVQRGDDDMTCPQINAEIEKMDGVIKASLSQSDQSRQSMGTTNAVGSGASIASAPVPIPLLGPAIKLAMSPGMRDDQQKMQQGMQDADDAKERKMHLLEIANYKHCG